MMGSVSRTRPAASATKCPFANGKFSLEQFQRALNKHPDNPFQAMKELHEQQGDTFEFTTPEGKFIFDHSPETARKLITETEGEEATFEKSASQTHGLAQVLGEENVLLSSGGQWQASREVMEPHFSASAIKTDDNIAKISRILDRHFDKIDQTFNDKEQVVVDLDPLFQKATLDVALNQIFSTQASEEQLSTLCEAYDTLNQRVGQEWLIPSAYSGLEAPEAEYHEARATIHNYADDLVTKRLKISEQPDDALAGLMSAVDPETGAPFSKERLVSEVKNLMLAGHETTANLLSWIVSDLARSPEKQSQLVSQIAQAAASDVPTKESLRAIPSLRQTWRKQAVEHPPNYLLARVAKKDTTIGPEDHPIPVEAGTTIMVSTQEANKGGPMFSFGGGPRFCLGFNLARLETELATARFLQRFEVTDSGARGVQSSLAQGPADTEVTVRRREA